MRPTRRGLAVLALVGLAMLAAAVSGQRSLNAVAAPLLAAMGYGALQCWRADPPTVEVGQVRPGHPGETRSVEITFEGNGVVQVESDWPAGVDGEAVDAVLALPASITAEVTLAERGVHEVGELRVSRRDALGLVGTAVTVAESSTVVVYPRIHRVDREDALSELLADEHRIERQEFDRLREYEPGDPLRRIHWKSSAKRDGFLVVEFAADGRHERLTIAAEAVPGRADEMATAVGTVALYALRAGLDVGVELPGDGLPAGSGEAHRANLLALLARAEAGSLAEANHEGADVSIVASHRATSVRIGDRSVTFDELRSDADAGPLREVAPT